MGTDACGNGYSAALPWLWTPGNASSKTGGKRISEVFVTMVSVKKFRKFFATMISVKKFRKVFTKILQ